ncbi:MAG TPA: hypothetical protein VEH58_04520 [Dehalococcoidales bacterium]|nr:hypothetical protein [Dehalococcoidales bacterium]
MSNTNNFYLAVKPYQALAVDTIGKIAVIFQKNSYDTQLLLSSKIPLIVAYYDELKDAEAIAGDLQRFGLNTLICREEELLSIQDNFQAHRCSFENESIIFWDTNNRAMNVGKGKISLIVVASLSIPEQKKTIETKMKLDLTATLLTGGLPVVRRVRKESTQVSTNVERLIKLYDKKTTDFCIEIKQRGFNYSVLGNKIAPSSFINFTLLQSRLASFFTSAKVDESLKDFSTVNESAVDTFDVTSRLIYLFHKQGN